MYLVDIIDFGLFSIWNNKGFKTFKAFYSVVDLFVFCSFKKMKINYNAFSSDLQLFINTLLNGFNET